VAGGIAESYRHVAQWHRAGIEAKTKMLQSSKHGNKTAEERYRTEYERNIAIAEAMLKDLIRQVEEIIEGKRTVIEPVERILKQEEGGGT
jgi:hypothetical protein